MTKPSEQDVRAAMALFDRLNFEGLRKKYGYKFSESRRYDLIHSGKPYPPKTIYTVARKLSDPNYSVFDAYGGRASNRPLQSLGFKVVEKLVPPSHGALTDNMISTPNMNADYILNISIPARRGQLKFRNNLLAAYERKCAVTACSEVALLEAAHVKPYSRAGDYDVKNGVLLRSDIHTRFGPLEDRSEKLEIGHRQESQGSRLQRTRREEAFQVKE